MRALRGTVRYWLPLVAGLLCLVVGLFVGSIVAWLLLFAAMGLILDGLTATWERARRGGNLTTHDQ
jgi:hypothetical protein